MRPRNKAVKILKFLGKTILVLLLILLSLILLIHTQPVQKRLTHRLTSYLSAKIGSRVEIEKVRFSLLGNLSIEHLQVWDADSIRIISVNHLRITSDLRDLISGDYIMKELEIEGVDVVLNELEDGLNIQYILEAFVTKGPQDSVPSELTVLFNKILLENIDFHYSSKVNGTSISVHLEKCLGNDAAYSTNPDKVKADIVSIDNLAVDILNADTTEVNQIVKPTIGDHYFTPDFGLGIQLEINQLNVRHSALVYETIQPLTTLQFDPSHLKVSDIQFALHYGNQLFQETNWTRSYTVQELDAIISWTHRSLPAIADVSLLLFCNDCFFLSNIIYGK